MHFDTTRALPRLSRFALDNHEVEVCESAQLYDLPTISSGCLCIELPYCCYNLSKMIENFETGTDDKIKTLKNLLFAQEGGLSVEYRCIKCRNCWQCKNADETEKLSLTEEHEKFLIKQSVKLDFKNKAILCTLPERGPEREFLTSNKDMASKVLLSVCKRYFKVPEAKELID